MSFEETLAAERRLRHRARLLRSMVDWSEDVLERRGRLDAEHVRYAADNLPRWRRELDEARRELRRAGR